MDAEKRQHWNEYMRVYRKKHPDVNKNACYKWKDAHKEQVKVYAHEHYMKRKGKTNDESGIQAVDSLQDVPVAQKPDKR